MSINKTKYSGQDFLTYLDEIRNRIQTEYGSDFNDFALSGLGQMLIDYVAFALDNLSFYLDRRASEAYLDTALTRTAVSRLTRQIGYKMRGAVPSSVGLSVAVKNPVAYSVTLPVGFQFNGPGDLVFEVASEVTFAPSEQGADKPKTVTCFEGETLTESFVSDGTPNQVFELRKVPTGKWVSSGSVKVRVDGTDYSEVQFLEFDQTDQFETDYVSDPPTVRFGDGVAGNIPPDGATIEVTYLATSGAAGQVNQGTITSEVSPLVVNFQTVPLVVSNPAGSSGGADPESVEEAKANAPRVFRTRLAAVTKQDYEALAQSFADPAFGRVAVAQAFSARSIDQDTVVKSELDTIQAASEDPKKTVDVEIPKITGSLDTIDANATDLTTQLGSVGSKASDISTESGTVRTSARAIRSKANENSADLSAISSDASTVKSVIQTNSATIQTESQSGQATINGITVGASDQLTTATRDALLQNFTNIDTARQNIDNTTDDLDNIVARTTPLSSKNTEIISEVDNTIVPSLDNIDQAVSDIGTDTTSGLLKAADADRASVATESVNIRTSASAIDAVVVSTSSTVAASRKTIEDHVDLILNSDAEANMVTVPILALDAAGFYTAPTVGLIQSLQAYLDARKDVTHSVVVVSGENFLLPAVIEARVGISTGVSQSVLEAAVNAAIDGLLKGRKFGQDLYVSDITDALTALPGVVFANVTIKGHNLNGSTVTNNLDVSGNLLASDKEIVTKGSVTATVEVVSA